MLLATSVASAARAAGPSVTLSPAASRLAAYLAIDTTNPPGNERAGAELLAGLLRAAGIEPRLLVSPRGRVSLLARLEATTRAPSGAAGGDDPGALVLLHHIDTVPAGSGWRQGAPAAGAVHDGELWGRGAIDTKGLGIAHLMAFLDLARSPLPRRRAVVFLAVADEEAGGGEGTGWLLSAHPELFADVDAVLNEGGVNKAVAGRTLFWGIEVDQKRPLWLEVARRRPAGARLGGESGERDASPRLRPRRAGRGAAPAPGHSGGDPVPRRPRALRPAGARRPGASSARSRARGDANDSRPLSLPGFESLLTDTLQVTTLAGSERINVVAGEARAGIDVRLLPDTDEQAFVAGIERTLGPGFTVKVRLTSPAAPPSPVGSAVFRTLAATLAAAGAGGAGGAPEVRRPRPSRSSRPSSRPSPTRATFAPAESRLTASRRSRSTACCCAPSTLPTSASRSRPSIAEWRR